MKLLPPRPDIEQLKKQAKELLRGYRAGDAEALARLRAALPAAFGRDDAALMALGLRLYDAQSCVAREYGFASWSDLGGYVAACADDTLPGRRAGWLRLVYAGDVAGGNARARPAAAARLLDEQPALGAGDVYLACAVGDVERVRRALAGERAWLTQPGGPLRLPPLVAVAHSSLLRLPAFAPRLRECARLLVAAGADPNQTIGNRWPPASLATPDETARLSALYGAAGVSHDAPLVRLLLDAGADPDDGESLYHALDSRECARLLLAAGARVAGSHVLYRALDGTDLALLQLLLAHGGDANEPPRAAPLTEWGSPLLWAIYRRRSAAQVAALLAAGADARATTPDGVGAYHLALRFGLAEVAALLEPPAAALSDEEQLLAACGRGDAAAARQVIARRPDLPRALAPSALRLLPDLASNGAGDAVRLMVALGWPIAARGGDWSASALNHAVFRGDPALTRFLLEHGARLDERHGFGDDVCGTLSWASCNQPLDGGDWVGCAEALRAHGLPAGETDPVAPGAVSIAGHSRYFSDEVTEVLLAAHG